MKSKFQFWFFQRNSNPPLLITIYGEDSAKNFVTLFSQVELTFWTVQTDEDPKARAVLSHPALKVEAPVAAPKEAKVNKAEPIQGLDRRKFPRLNVKLDILLVRGEVVFSTHTIDASVGGLKLEKGVPKVLVNQLCKVFISHSSGLNLEFEAKILETSDRGTRVMFETMSEYNKVMFENWLERRLRAQKG